MYILSLNCYLFAPHVLTASKWIRSRADARVAKRYPDADVRIRDITKYILASEADVVCLQGVWGLRNKNLMISLLRQVYTHSYGDPYNPVINIDSGLMMLTRCDMAETSILYFKNTGAWFSNKGVIAVSLPHYQCIVATTHLDTNEPIAVAELSSVLNSHRSSDNSLPLYLVGDLNLTTDKIPTVAGWRRLTPEWDNNSDFEDTRCLDHCMTTSGEVNTMLFVDRVPINTFITDHAAVHVRINEYYTAFY